MNIEIPAFEIEYPSVFDKTKILAGVVKRNLELFPPDGFNISFNAGFERDMVNNHRKLLADHLGFDIASLKFQEQVHGTRIRRISNDSPEDESDGIYTSETGLLLCVSIADCAAVLIHDPVNCVIAAVHSGWRGTKENISSLCIELLKKEFSSDPRDLLAWISPCASGERYEVGWDVARYFPESVSSKPDGKYLFDNKKEIKSQLINCGIIEEKIEISDVCTISDENYHSYRRDKDKSGRMAAFIRLQA